MPCLNEADTIGICVQKAMRSLHEQGITGELIVADNGSSDDSREIAAGLGARVVRVVERGYGNALMAGIAVARGRFVVDATHSRLLQLFSLERGLMLGLLGLILVGSARRSAPRADPGDVPRYDLGAGRRQELAARPPATARLDWRTALVLLTLTTVSN